ncbi:uncharacterized protein [Dasypus novemcinctus]|uniref:uncharacterized protein isoform X2 n=1 Tax=Dasypus novemcinctus TaxID=9361 RepID=UPI0039C8EF94
MERLRGSQDGGAGARSPDAAHRCPDQWTFSRRHLEESLPWALDPSALWLHFGTPVDEFELLLPGAAPPGPSRGRPPFVGLVNHGLTDYLNALLQCLFVTPEFRDRVQKAPRSSRLQQELEQIFRGLEALRSSRLQQTASRTWARCSCCCWTSWAGATCRSCFRVKWRWWSSAPGVAVRTTSRPGAGRCCSPWPPSPGFVVCMGSGRRPESRPGSLLDAPRTQVP